MWNWLAYGVGGVGVVSVLLYIFQDYLLYFPTIENSRTVFITPTHGLAEVFEEHFLTTPDGVVLNLWLFRQPTENRPTLLFFHGNAGNISHRLPNIRLLYHRLEFNIAILEYRGFGRSTGWPHQKGIEIDSKTALKFLKSKEGTGDSPVVLFGRSLGGAVAIYLATSDAADQVDAVIVENTFTCIADMIDVLMRHLRFAKPLLTNPWRSIDLVDKLELPTLFISSTNDELVPPVMMDQLYDRCRSPQKAIHRYPTHHMDAWVHEDYFEKIAEWCSEQGL